MANIVNKIQEKLRDRKLFNIIKKEIKGSEFKIIKSGFPGSIYIYRGAFPNRKSCALVLQGIKGFCTSSMYLTDNKYMELAKKIAKRYKGRFNEEMTIGYCKYFNQ